MSLSNALCIISALRTRPLQNTAGGIIFSQESENSLQVIVRSYMQLLIGPCVLSIVD